MEGADLHAPAAAGLDRFGGPVHVQADLGGAETVDARGFGRGNGEIENPAVDKGAAIGDAHDGELTGLDVGDRDERTHGQGAVRGGEGAVAEDLSVGGFAAFVGRGIPGGQAYLGEDGLVGIDEIEVIRADPARRHGGDGDARWRRRLCFRGLTLGRRRSGLPRGRLGRLAVMGAAGQSHKHKGDGRKSHKGRRDGQFSPYGLSGPMPGLAQLEGFAHQGRGSFGG